MTFLHASIVAAMSAASMVWSADVSTPEDLDGVFERYIQLGEELVPVLQKVQDRKTADSAAQEVQNMLLQVDESRLETRAIKELTPEQARHIRDKYEVRMRATWGKVYDEIYRLQKMRCYGSVDFLKPFSLLCSFLEK